MLKVDTIEQGTVIDHIKAGKGEKVLRMLGIDEDYTYRVALVMNVSSKEKGKKDIVKIEGKEVSERNANKIALISPSATINIIKNEKVIKKFKVELPKDLTDAGKCPNPNCITNHEVSIQMFKLEKDRYRCHYCERSATPEELVK